MSAPEIISGTVKWFNAEKGFGFISTADRGDVFVHLRALGEGRTALNAGEQVYFTLRETPKGLEAANVRVGAPPPPPKPAQPSVALATPALPAAVKMRVVARPAAVHPLGRAGQAPSLVAFTVELGAEAAPPPAVGLPARGAPTTCLVLMSLKHWRSVKDALAANEQDALVVDGYAGLDPLAPGMLALRATSVATHTLLNARRVAQERRTPDDAEPAPPEGAERAGGDDKQRS